MPIAGTNNLWGRAPASPARGSVCALSTLQQTYTYDKLNRMATKSYSDGSTPSVTFGYDTGAGTCANGSTAYDAGRLTSISTTAAGSAPAVTEYMSYDPLGRICQSQEQVGSSGPYPFTYVYNLAGGLTSEVYPSGRVVTSSYDLQNRPAGVSSGPVTYVGSVSYASNDAPAQISFGAAASPWGTETVAFDPVRQQPLTVTAVTGSTTQLALNYLYCAGQNFGASSACATNNGNVVSAGITTPALNLTQVFGYDGGNRLTSAMETSAAAVPEWNQSYSYDQWGNRAVSGNYTPNSYATPTDLTQYQNNRWLGPGASYDAAGNQLSLPARSFTYDEENRLVSSAQPNMDAIGYAYDGEGRRVLKTVGTTSSTVYVYDAAGQLAAEYSMGVGGAGGTQYPITDALGSTRMLLGYNAASATWMPEEMLDYLPFGEEIAWGVGRRGTLYPSGGYPGQPDLQPLKFTGKERDAETGLDYFGARYFSGAMGRFTSPDNFLNDTTALDPQSWNLYPYARNNPLRYVDPTGEKIYVGSLSADDQQELLKRVNATYGCNGCVSADKTGYLQVDTSGLNEKTLAATGYLTGAINSTDFFAKVEVSNNDPTLAFGETKLGATSVEWDGHRINASLIRLDFADDRWVGGDSDAKQTFLNTVFAHEVAHIFPTYIRDPTTTGPTGPVVDTVNGITNALGQPRRTGYISSTTGGYWLSLPFAKSSVDKNGRSKDKAVQIEWLKRNVGGRGVN